MKQFNILFFALVCFVGSLQAQVAAVDTVFHEDFETDISTTWQLFPLGDDTTWVNVDVDGLTPNNGQETHKQWYWREFFSTPFEIDSLTGDTIYYITNCVASNSWMTVVSPSNRNWLVTPPVTVTDDTYVLSFQSATLQLPRYMDGYSVRISTTSNDMLEVVNPFTDLIFQAASMGAITGDGTSILPGDFSFTPGYIHADTVSNWEYMEVFSPSEIGSADTTLLGGLLEPHSVSLAAYAGKTIYIAFVHDADDDNQMALDDVLVTKAKNVSANNPASLDLRFRAFPNPVVNNMNALFRLENAARASMKISDMNGRIMAQPIAAQRLEAGEYNLNLNLLQLPSGNYTLTLNVDGKIVSSMFTKW